MAKQKWTNRDLQDTTHITKDRTSQTPLIPGMNSCAPEQTPLIPGVNSCAPEQTPLIPGVNSCAPES